MNTHQSMMIYETFQAVFFTLGRMSKFMPDEVRADLIADMQMRTNDPTCPPVTKEAVRGIIEYMME